MVERISTGLSLEIGKKETMVNIISLQNDVNGLLSILDNRILPLQVAMPFLEASNSNVMYVAQSGIAMPFYQELYMRGCPIQKHSMTRQGRTTLYTSFFEHMNRLKNKNDDSSLISYHATLLSEYLLDGQPGWNSNKSLAFALAWYGLSKQAMTRLEFD